MTYQGMAKLFRIYLEGKMNYLKKDQGAALEKIFQSGFGTKEYYRANSEYDAAGAKVRLLADVIKQFDNIFKKEDIK